MLKHDNALLLADQVGSHHIVVFTQADYQTIYHTDVADAQQIAADNAGKHHSENQRRNSDHGVRQTHDDGVDPTAEVAGNQTQRCTDQRCPDTGQQARDQ